MLSLASYDHLFSLIQTFQQLSVQQDITIVFLISCQVSKTLDNSQQKYQIHQIKLMKTSSTFWSQLEADIQKYSKKAKVNIRQSEKLSRLKGTKKIVNKSIKSKTNPQQKLSVSINQIRDKHRESKSIERSLKNRINYLSVQKDHKVQSTEGVREKYQKIVSIRSSSLREKKFVNEEIINSKNEYYLSRKSRVLKIQGEKGEIDKSKKKLFGQKYNMASSVRFQSKKNEETIGQSKERQLEKKKKAVHDVQVSEQKSAEFFRKLTSRKVQIGKKNHQKKLWDEHKKLQLQNKRNSSLIDKFSERVNIIRQQKEKAEEQAQMYRSFLGLNRGRRSLEKPTVSTPNKLPKKNYYVGSIKNSFYLTG